MRFYHYIGPARISERVLPAPSGAMIRTSTDVVQWARDGGQRPGRDGCVVATFVVDATGALLVADRHSEHVACAGRQPVRSAGEITFHISAAVEVVAVSNQSTGHCPEPESWPAVAAALSAAGLESPVGFALACVFRLCPGCGSTNVVKGGLFECGVCGADLPTTYNCQHPEIEPGAAPDGCT